MLPKSYEDVASFLKVLNQINPQISQKFVSNYTVRSRIVESMRTDSLEENLDGFKNLIKAIYRCDKEVWKLILNQDGTEGKFNSINLSELYTEVQLEIEKERGTEPCRETTG